MNQTAEDRRSKPFRSVLGVVAGVLVLALFVAGMRSYRDLSVQRTRQAALESRIADTTSRIETLQHEIELLESDPGTLERVAREDLGMSRPGDVVIRLEPSPLDEPDTTPSGD